MDPVTALGAMDELMEDILLRCPADDPARLVRAALVCKRWCRIVAGAGFRRRFREFHRAPLLTVDYHIKVHMDLQTDKSPVVVKGPFFPQVVNPRYRIRGTMCNARIQSSKARKAIL
jgi:hypothetical protein